MVGPVGDRRLLAGKLREPAVDEVLEALAGDIDVLAVAIDEVHRDIQRIVAVALVPEPILEDEGQHSGAVGVGVFPDTAAEALVTVGLAFGERRIGEERGRDRLQGQADAKLLHHVGF